MLDSELFDLSCKVAVVTGAGSGLGSEFCEVLAQAGADVVVSDADLAAAEATAKRVDGLGRRGLAVRCDVTDEREVDDQYRIAVAELGRVDILFNNPGIADPTPQPQLLHTYPGEHWHKVLAVDLHGVFYNCRETLKVMVEQGSGKIIDVASMWGLFGASSVFPIPADNTAQRAVVDLTRELGLEPTTAGIQVNALCPGLYRPRLAGGAYDDPDIVAAVTAFTPMGRVAEAAEIRGPALFLASPASDDMTGQMLVMDGGCTAK